MALKDNSKIAQDTVMEIFNEMMDQDKVFPFQYKPENIGPNQFQDVIHEALKGVIKDQAILAAQP